MPLFGGAPSGAVCVVGVRTSLLGEGAREAAWGRSARDCEVGVHPLLEVDLAAVGREGDFKGPAIGAQIARYGAASRPRMRSE